MANFKLQISHQSEIQNSKSKIECRLLIYRLIWFCIGAKFSILALPIKQSENSMSKKITRVFSLLFLLGLIFQSIAFPQKTNSSITPKRHARLVIRNAMIVDGSGKPASGNYDIVVENDLITQIVGLDPVAV